MDATLKDKLTNWCGLIVVIAGAILTATTMGVVLPAWLLTGATVLGAVAGGLIGWVTGKPVTGVIPPTSPVVPNKTN